MKFPTLAERAVAEWQALQVTKPFEKIALVYGAFRDDFGFAPRVIEWVFDDDTTVTVVGRGANYKIESHLP